MKPRLFVASRVYRSAHDPSPANAILVSNGRVLHVGLIDDLRAIQPNADIVDLGDVVITPGLTDAHIHVTEWALARQQVQLGAAATIDECLALIARAPRTGAWMQGRGWNPHKWGGAYPHRQQLDSVTGDQPAAFQSHDMHALWVNSIALQVAGIDAHSADPEGGRIVRNERGEPTGMLRETAAQLVVGRIPEITLAELLPAVLDAQRELHSYGITGVHSFPGVHLPEPDPL
ncbi:MAG TPA: amidohydrolase family protein, partial [Longimicrobiales bacterium]